MAKKRIYTIGYEGVTVEGLVRKLSDAGVEVLIDVRAVPLSRKPGFSKNRLAERLAVSGIEYVGLKGLGTPAEGRAAARKGRTGEMRQIFGAHLETPAAEEDMRRAIDIAKKRPACLLCFEHLPQTCHRLMVAEIMAAQSGFDIQNLDPVHS